MYEKSSLLTQKFQELNSMPDPFLPESPGRVLILGNESQMLDIITKSENKTLRLNLGVAVGRRQKATSLVLDQQLFDNYSFNSLFQ